MLPYLSEVQNPSKKYSVMFRGINYGEGTQDGEFAETYNLSTDNYPCITQRAARIEAGQYTEPTTLHHKGKLLVIDGTDVIYGGKKVGTVTKGKKQTATIGNYIVIFPDKKYYKVPTEDDQDGEFGSMEEEYTATELTFTSSEIFMLGTKYKASELTFTSNSISLELACKETGLNFYGSATHSYIYKDGVCFPFKVGDVVIISGCADASLNVEAVVKDVKSHMEYSDTGYLYFEKNTFSSNTRFTDAGEVTITRKAEGEFPFREGDTVIISGCSTSANNKEVVIKEATDTKLTFDNNSFVKTVEYDEITITRIDESNLPFREGDAVTISGCSIAENNKDIIIRDVSAKKLTFYENSFTAGTESGSITIKRTVPDLDFICESNYRLWGTHGNTIYSSKFSDPFNFKVFDGLADDSYFIDVGSEGEFTGCIAYSSHICFFKENTLHKLYGTKPSNFQINTVNVYGVQSGCERSMQIVNEMLLYKGVGGVYAYTGGVPELISDKFGNRRYSEAVACCDGEKYYVSMKQGDIWNMFTFDVAKNIWLREDDTHAVDMTFFDGKVYFLDASGGLYYIDKEADRSGIEWGATFCTMHETVNERKGYSKFHLRMDLSAGAWLAVDVKTDTDTQWRQIYTTHNEKAKTVSIPIIPTRCDSIDIRLRGKGKCTIKAFIREFTVGSDV